MFYIDSETSQLYQGTRQPGDRIATTEEVVEFAAKLEKRKKKEELKQKLLDIDLRSIRSLRENNKNKLDEFEQEAVTLRDELTQLGE